MKPGRRLLASSRRGSMAPHGTVAEVEGSALTTGRLVFGGDRAEVWAQVESNVRDPGQPS